MKQNVILIIQVEIQRKTRLYGHQRATKIWPCKRGCRINEEGSNFGVQGEEINNNILRNFFPLNRHLEM